jgi:hypothetical protein
VGRADAVAGTAALARAHLAPSCRSDLEAVLTGLPLPGEQAAQVSCANGSSAVAIPALFQARNELAAEESAQDRDISCGMEYSDID